MMYTVLCMLIPTDIIRNKMVKVPDPVLQPSLSATLQNPDTQVKTLFMKMLRIESLFLKKVDNVRF